MQRKDNSADQKQDNSMPENRGSVYALMPSPAIQKDDENTQSQENTQNEQSRIRFDTDFINALVKETKENNRPNPLHKIHKNSEDATIRVRVPTQYADNPGDLYDGSDDPFKDVPIMTQFANNPGDLYDGSDDPFKDVPIMIVGANPAPQEFLFIQKIMQQSIEFIDSFAMASFILNKFSVDMPTSIWLAAGTYFLGDVNRFLNRLLTTENPFNIDKNEALRFALSIPPAMLFAALTGWGLQEILDRKLVSEELDPKTRQMQQKFTLIGDSIAGYWAGLGAEYGFSKILSSCLANENEDINTDHYPRLHLLQVLAEPIKEAFSVFCMEQFILALFKFNASTAAFADNSLNRAALFAMLLGTHKVMSHFAYQMNPIDALRQPLPSLREKASTDNSSIQEKQEEKDANKKSIIAGICRTVEFAGAVGFCLAIAGFGVFENDNNKMAQDAENMAAYLAFSSLLTMGRHWSPVRRLVSCCKASLFSPSVPSEEDPLIKNNIQEPIDGVPSYRN